MLLASDREMPVKQDGLLDRDTAEVRNVEDFILKEGPLRMLNDWVTLEIGGEEVNLS